MKGRKSIDSTNKLLNVMDDGWDLDDVSVTLQLEVVTQLQCSHFECSPSLRWSHFRWSRQFFEFWCSQPELMWYVAHSSPQCV